jgi:hypothetical protein
MEPARVRETTTSRIQLRKALNDPIRGVTALRRVGVSFTQGAGVGQQLAQRRGRGNAPIGLGLDARLKRMPGVVELLWRTAGHFDHLHVAMDKAGWYNLRPALNLVGNYTGRPEPVSPWAAAVFPSGTFTSTSRTTWGTDRFVTHRLK